MNFKSSKLNECLIYKKSFPKRAVLWEAGKAC